MESSDNIWSVDETYCIILPTRTQKFVESTVSDYSTKENYKSFTSKLEREQRPYMSLTELGNTIKIIHTN